MAAVSSDAAIPPTNESVVTAMDQAIAPDAAESQTPPTAAGQEPSTDG